MTNIKISKDFEQIRYAHDTFLTKIQSQCFMLHKPVKIIKIFLFNLKNKKTFKFIDL